MRISIVAILVIAMVAPKIAWAGEPPTQGTPPADAQADDSASGTIPFDADKTHRMTVDVAFDGKGSYPFIVDTGAARTAIASELAERLALKKGSSVKLHAMTGVKTVSSVMIPHLTVNSLNVAKLQVPLLNQADMGAPGLLGIDALQSRRLLVDFQTGTMSVMPSLKLKQEWNGTPDEATVVVTARRYLGQLILTKANVAGSLVDVIVDTGLQVSIGNEALRRRLFARDGAAHGSWHPVTLISVTGDTMVVDSATVDHLRVANMDIANLPLAFADAHPFVVLDLVRAPALLLGMDVLRLFDQVSLDFRTKEVGFRWSRKKSPPPPAESN